MLTILPPNDNTIQHLNQSDSRFLAGELVQIRVTRKGFLPEYLPLATAEWRKWPPCPQVTVENVKQHDDWACFFAFVDGKFVGQLAACPDGYCLCKLLDLRVDSNYRRQGIASALLSACVDWAARQSFKGMRVETSDENPVACQFFQDKGFTLGGVDKLRHFMDNAQSDRAPGLRDSVLSFYRFLN